MQTCEINEKVYPITGFVQAENKETGEELTVPVVNIPIMSDRKYQMMCLNDRINYPEKYEAMENVEETVTKLQRWLREHKPE